MTRRGASRLRSRNLRKRYGQKVAVDDLSLRVNEGEIFGILGPNGAGKTTTVECAEGLRHPDGGTVRVFGIDPYRDRTEARQLVGVQLQESQLPDKLTVAEAISLYASFYPQARRHRGAHRSPWPDREARTPATGSCPAGRSSACRSPSPSSAARAWSSSTS